MIEVPVPPIVERQTDDGTLEVFPTVEAAARSCCCGGWHVREGHSEFYDSRGSRLKAWSSDDDSDPDVEISFDPEAVADPGLLADRLRHSLRNRDFCELPDVGTAGLADLLTEHLAVQQRFERTTLVWKIRRFFGRVDD